MRKTNVRQHMRRTPKGRITTVTRHSRKLKNLSYSQLRNQGIKLKPTGDADRDGVPNSLDCKPLNKKEQGLIHDYFKKRRELKKVDRKIEKQQRKDDIRFAIAQKRIAANEKREDRIEELKDRVKDRQFNQQLKAAREKEIRNQELKKAVRQEREKYQKERKAKIEAERKAKQRKKDLQKFLVKTGKKLFKGKISSRKRKKPKKKSKRKKKSSRKKTITIQV